MTAFLRPACVALAIMALGLAGCGRRGSLEPPPDASVKTATPSADAPAPAGSQSTVEGGRGPRTPRGVTAPKQPFILDPLL